MSVMFSWAHSRKARPVATPQVTTAVSRRHMSTASWHSTAISSASSACRLARVLTCVSLRLVVSGPSLRLNGSRARSMASARMNRPAKAPHWLSMR